MAISKVTVTGSFVREDGSPSTGYITFQLSSPLSDGSSVFVSNASPVVGVLSAGAFSVSLYATEDATTQPNNASYTVTLFVDGETLTYSGLGLPTTPSSINVVTWINLNGGTNPGTVTNVAGGDLSGSYPNPTVDGIQGRAVSSTAPTTSQVLGWNGTNWIPMGPYASIDPSNRYQLFTSSGSFTVPTNVTRVRVRAIGAGGGGGGAGSALTSGGVSNQAPGGGGGAGMITESEIVVTPGESLTVTIGAGGTGGTGGGANGNAGGNGNTGGNTTIKRSATTLVAALGGGSALTNSAGNTATSGKPGAWGSGDTSDLSSTVVGPLPGWGGSYGLCDAHPNNIVVGGAAGGPATATKGGSGGPGLTTAPAITQGHGSSGGSATTTGGNGNNATIPGCGGGGGGGGAPGGAGGNGGNGAPGQLEIWW